MGGSLCLHCVCVCHCVFVCVWVLRGSLDSKLKVSGKMRRFANF